MRFLLLLLALAFIEPTRADVPLALRVNTSPLQIALDVSRPSGTCVAPCAQFFSAIGTTSAAVTSLPIHEIEYRWDFGDAGSGSWGDKSTGSAGSAGNTSRNIAVGPVAAHVYESADTYKACVTANDGTNSNSVCTSFTVADPDTYSGYAATKTYCVRSSATGTFAGCPSGATQATNADFSSAMSAAISASARRILFRRGDTFTASTQYNLTTNGPGTVGAFGSGAAPIITGDSNAAVIYLSSSSTPTFTDWRFMDLEINGLSTANSVYPVQANGGANQITLLRLNVHDFGATGVQFSSSILDFWNANGSPGHTIYDQIAVADSNITNAGQYGVFCTVKRLGFLGNFVDNVVVGGEHVFRAQYLKQSALSNNTFSRGAANKHTLTVRGPDFTGTGVTSGYTEQVVISDNKIIGDREAQMVLLAPQDDSSNPTGERLRNVIFERNWIVASATNTYGVMVWGTYFTLRDNVIDFTARVGNAIMNEIGGHHGAAPTPVASNIYWYNNTAYKNSSGIFTFLDWDATFPAVVGSTFTVKNTLAYAPAATSTVMINSTGLSGIVSGSNSSDGSGADQIKSTTPNFTSVSPFTPANAKPTSGYAVAGGVAVPVWSDFFLAAEPATRDIGAVAH